MVEQVNGFSISCGDRKAQEPIAWGPVLIKISELLYILIQAISVIDQEKLGKEEGKCPKTYELRCRQKYTKTKEIQINDVDTQRNIANQGLSTSESQDGKSDGGSEKDGKRGGDISIQCKTVSDSDNA